MIIEHFLAVASLLSIFIILAIVSNIFLHDRAIMSKSKFRFTIGIIKNNYHEGDVRGKYIEYSMNGIKYENYCRGEKCIRTVVKKVRSYKTLPFYNCI